MSADIQYRRRDARIPAPDRHRMRLESFVIQDVEETRIVVIREHLERRAVEQIDREISEVGHVFYMNAVDRLFATIKSRM